MYKSLQYEFFTPGRLRPTGWLRQQLRRQAEGLHGNLDKIWPDVRDSAWVGGDREGWERVPYWLDGFIPLAYLLEDSELIARAKTYVDAILARQEPDGWLCPCTPEERGDYDTWAALLIGKALALYGECSGDPRIPDALDRFLQCLDRHLNFHTLRNWGAARWFEGLLCIFYLYDRRPQPYLLDLAKKLRFQGFDWRAILEEGFPESFGTQWNYHTHVVNLAMMLKSEALFSRVAELDPEYLATRALKYLDARHGMACGHFTGDECLAGDSPVQGTELCGVVEAMFSYEQLFSVTGNPMYLDRLERLAFNALPAAVSPDMWSHQYDQMTNQVAAFPMAKQPFHTNGPEAHLFGLEPNFGCCTANFGQGWPKLAMTALMRSPKGIASCALIPAEVDTQIQGKPVHCQLITEYPFRNLLTYRITAPQPVTFTLSVRIPAWATAQVQGETVSGPGFWETTQTWEGTQEVTVQLNFATEVKERPGDMVCVWRGPLLYAAPVEEQRERVEYVRDGVERKYPYCDYYLYPVSPWNYGLTARDFTYAEHPYDNPFDPTAPPVTLTASMAEIPWGFHNGHCDPQPQSREPLGPPREIRLIPYGCTNLRLAEFPCLE